MWSLWVAFAGASFLAGTAALAGDGASPARLVTPSAHSPEAEKVESDASVAVASHLPADGTAA